MNEQRLYDLFFKKSSWLSHLIYWTIAALLMFFIFSNKSYDLQIRITLVSLLIVFSYFITLIINNLIIPKYLFTGKILVFTYFIFAIFIFTLWLISFSIIVILAYSAFNLPNMIIPQRHDIVILVAGNYLIVIMAAVIHFIKESYRRLNEKDNIKKQKQITELKLKEAKLKLLQGQIHPHFIFNMLNNLYGLINDNPEQSKETIIKLSELLDYMLYECNDELVDLNKEIDFIKNYISLEKIRHDEDFNVTYSFPEQTKYTIAPLILFPFIENAFKHGLQDVKDNFIELQLLERDNLIIFNAENSISDIGNDKYLNQEGKGIGLQNIKERLNYIYKGKYNLKIINENGVFKVHLEIQTS